MGDPPDTCRMNFPFWSATPTPFLKDMSVDTASVRKLVERHVRLEVDGLFIGGSCGEGPWMTLQQKSDLLDTVCASAAGRIRIAVQVTDNSALRVLEAIKTLPPVDYVVVAQPYFFMRSTTERLRGFYLDILEKSPMPVCYYDRPLGPSIVSPPEEILEEIYAHPNLRMIKDSCGDARRQELALAARKQRPDLLLLNGDEFRFLDFIRRGYDGAMLGGGIINAPYVKEIFEAHQRGDAARGRGAG